MEALGTLRPTHEPRATEYIGQMIAMIEMLIAQGHAYAAEGHVLFSVDSYKAYGALSGRSVEDMIAGARVEVAPYKRDPMDFVLWKPSDEGTPGWDSPWGRGRPGWHIECSAMSYELLGDSFDIHGGGIDLQFPHHENEIAQSCCAHPKGKFANYWLHNEMLQVEGKKMSKSLGNFFTVRDLLDQSVPGEVIRMVFLGTHYGKPMDWTEKKRAEAEATLRKWRGLVTGVEPGEVSEVVVKALADDLNTAGALAELHRLADQIRRADGDLSGIPPQFLDGVRGADLGKIQSGLKRIFLASAQFLGLLTEELGAWAEVPQADLSDLRRDAGGGPGRGHGNQGFLQGRRDEAEADCRWGRGAYVEGRGGASAGCRVRRGQAGRPAGMKLFTTVVSPRPWGGAKAPASCRRHAFGVTGGGRGLTGPLRDPVGSSSPDLTSQRHPSLARQRAGGGL